MQTNSKLKSTFLLDDYLLKGNLDNAMDKVGRELLQIVRQLKKRPSDRLSIVVEDPLFNNISRHPFLSVSCYCEFV